MATVAGSFSNEAWRSTDPEIVVPPGGTDLDKIHWHENFERGVIGEAVQPHTISAAAPNGLRNAGNGTIYADHYPGVGTRCMQTFVEPGDTGFNRWGWGLPMPAVTQFGEVWWRMCIRTMPGFTANTGINLGLKHMRFVTRRETDQAGRGAFDNHLRNDANDTFQFMQYREYVSGSTTFTGVLIPRPEWTMVEIYALLHDDPQIGRTIIWVDGVRQFERYTETLSGPNEALNQFYWLTYFNGNEDPNRNPIQYMYCDQIAAALRGPLYGGGSVPDDTAFMDVDAEGHPYIGTAVK